MSVAHPHCFLRCPNVHLIPVPHSNPLEIDGSPRRAAQDSRIAIVVCPECGLASAYSVRDMVGHLVVDTLNPFQAGECHLVVIEAECDGENCEARKEIHVILGDDKGTWRPKATPKDWTFSDSARCEAGHKLHFEDSGESRWTNLDELPL